MSHNASGSRLDGGGAGVLLGEQLPLKHNTRTRRIEGLLVGGKECIVERNYLIFQRSAAWYAAWYAAAVTLNAKLVTQHSSWDNAMMYGGNQGGVKCESRRGRASLLPNPT